MPREIRHRNCVFRLCMQKRSFSVTCRFAPHAGGTYRKCDFAGVPELNPLIRSRTACRISLNQNGLFPEGIGRMYRTPAIDYGHFAGGGSHFQVSLNSPHGAIEFFESRNVTAMILCFPIIPSRHESSKVY
jgi:hypothetical protein